MEINSIGTRDGIQFDRRRFELTSGGCGANPKLEEKRMETIEYLSGFLKKIGVPNFLVVGIVVIVIWLLISGLGKGLRKKRKDRSSENDDNGSEETD